MPPEAHTYARERLAGETKEGGRRLATLRDLAEYAYSFFMGATGEQVYVLLMDSSLRVIDARLIAVGNIDEVKPLVRSVMELVILKRAPAVAITHNHPNGGVEYSRADAEFTLVLKRELELVGARLVEHIIIDSQGYLPLLKTLGMTEGDDRLIDLSNYYE